MSRGLQAAIASAIAGTSLEPVLLYEGDWASGMTRFWTGLGDLSWNGYTWTGIGTLGRISELAETTETRIEGITVELSGVPAENIALAMNQQRHGLDVTLYFGTRDASGVVTADQWFVGVMDTVGIEDSGDTARITVRYLSRLADMRKANGRRFTHEDQQSDYPTDRGLEFVSAIQDAYIQWGGGWRWP